jgi:hypothetical protein
MGGSGGQPTPSPPQELHYTWAKGWRWVTMQCLSIHETGKSVKFVHAPLDGKTHSISLKKTSAISELLIWSGVYTMKQKILG